MADFTNCLLTSGYALGCKDNTGGIQKVYIGNFEDVTFTEAADNSITTGVVSSSTSGLLVVGLKYTIETFVAGDDFLNVGAASNATGVTFVATGTTPTVWANSSTLEINPKFYTFEQRNENAEFLQDGQHSVENGTNFWVQTTNLIFHKNTSDLRNILLDLSKTSMQVIVLDQNGRYWWIGKQNGAELTASTSNMGKGYGDLNGSTIGIEGREPTPANEVTQAAFDTFDIN